MQEKYPIIIVALCIAACLFTSADAQVSISQYGEGNPNQPKLPQAHTEKSELATLDYARDILEMDALPDGSHWFVVDKFGVLQSILIDGVRSSREFNEIPKATAQLSPNGDYVIWLGLDRHFTERGFDSTLVYIYKNQELAGHFLSDYPTLEFSRTGKSWGVVLPFAYVYQEGDRDFVVVNGTGVGKNENHPRELSFDHKETSWAYRATTGKNEKLVESNRTLTLRTRIADVSATEESNDSVVYRFTPDVSFKGLLFEGREYDFGFEHVALLERTSYDNDARDTSHEFVTFRGKREHMYNWIANILIDSAGKHIAYFACDPAQDKLGKNANTNKTIVLHDGKVISGVFDGAGRLFMSPSGKHVVYTTRFDNGKVFLDTKPVPEFTQVQSCIWSPDESQIAYTATGPHGRVFVVLNGKRSPDYQTIGRVGWLPDRRGVQYVALVNGKLLKIKQYL